MDEKGRINNVSACDANNSHHEFYYYPFSFISRGSPVLPTETIPLNCKRSYVCVTEDDSCESLTDPIKEKVETQEEAYGVLANEMANCWWMFGEGKVNYVGEDF